jgi:hypothetical protein
MLLNEIANPNSAIRQLLKDINFTTTSEGNAEIQKRLEKSKIKPMLNNMRRYLLRCFLTPFDTKKTVSRRISFKVRVSGRPSATPIII